VPSSAIVNQLYIYVVDRDFGPFFLKFSSYFPYTGRLCINGHEWAKRQLAREGIAYEPLDNGFRSCADPARLQAAATGSARPVSRRSSASGWPACPTRTPPPTARPATL
jgi:hypothetical protein